MNTCLSFDISGETYAASLACVEEVLPFLPVEPVPASPVYLRGVIFVRGHIIPVVDAAERMKIRRDGPAPIDPHIVAFRIRDKLIGLIVDEAIDLVDLPEVAASADDLYVDKGPFGGMVEMQGTAYRIIDPEQLLTPGEVDEHARD
jgi:purine-binding chemotaxis protein CheW